MSMTEPAAPDIVTPSHRNQTDWNEDRVERLKQLVADGLSASEIGAVFHVTRNAIIGKIHRLKLVLRNSRGGSMGRTKSDKPKTRRVSPTSIHAIRRETRKRYQNGERGPWCAPVLPEIPPGTAVSFAEAEAHHCRWPFGDPGTADFVFCGAEAFERFPYCAGHCLIAYAPPEPRRTHAKDRAA